jgi:hypothetical protein
VSITRADGTIHETQLYGVQGAAHILEVDSAGAEVLLPAKRLKTERRKNSDGTWRMYNLWQAPDGGTFREPVIDTDDDKLRKLNRAERLRSIPEGCTVAMRQSVGAEIRARRVDDPVAHANADSSTRRLGRMAG